MVHFINGMTGVDMWVHEDRMEEYLAAGHRLAAEGGRKGKGKPPKKQEPSPPSEQEPAPPSEQEPAPEQDSGEEW